MFRGFRRHQAWSTRCMKVLGVSSTTASRTDDTNRCVHPQQYHRTNAVKFHEGAAGKSREEGLDEFIAKKKQVRLSGAAMLSALLVSCWVGVGSSSSTCNALQAVYRSGSRIP